MDTFKPMKRQLLASLLLGYGLACPPALLAADTNVHLSPAVLELARTEKSIPFREVIEATTHFRVLDFDTNNAAHLKLRQQLLEAAALAGDRAAKAGIDAERANEAGNHLEPFVRAALRDVGLPARVPVNTEGDAQATGYPDVEITGPTPCYLELKSYNATTANSTQRTFYYSPSAHPKVTRDALHLLLAYQLEKTTRDGRTIFMPVHWKLITLEDLLVDLKFEFNQNNRGLYGSDAGKALLSAGAVNVK
jgi:hypothetical protein